MNNLENKFFFFDLGGLMFDYRYSLAKVATSLGYPTDLFTTAWTEPHDKACRGDITPSEMWKEILKSLNFKGEVTDLTNLWVEGFTPNHQIHDLAATISKYCAVGILSNLYKGLFPILFSRELIPNINFSQIIISSDIGSRKPEPGMYIAAERRAARHPSDLVLWDDKQANVQAAIERGWTGILYDSTNPQLAIEEILDQTI